MRLVMVLRLIALMLIGALLFYSVFAPAVSHGPSRESQAWGSIYRAVIGAVFGALAHFRMLARR